MAKKKVASDAPKKKKAVRKKAVKKKVAKTTILKPEINIGLVGHVDHGKTTLTQCLSGKWTDTHSEEVKRGITIRLGYADSIIRKIPGKKPPECFTIKKEVDGKETEIVRKISFVDAPGHESLMATMLSGANIMDGALLLIAANEQCPQPQTREHLMALEISGIKNVIILQNKVDLVPTERVQRHYKQIKEFLKNTSYADAPVIPISAQHNVNVDFVLDAIEKFIPTPERKASDEFIMFIARSFDLNKPGTAINKLTGGVLGGSVASGKLVVGETVEIKPGQVIEEHNQLTTKPLTTKIVSLMTGGDQVDEISPGGSVAIMTELDPSVVKGDHLTGHLIGRPGKLPPVWANLTLEFSLLERVVGSKDDQQVEPLKQNEVLMLNVNSAATVGIITGLSNKEVVMRLRLPICAAVGARVTLSRRVENRFRLIGYGIIKN